MSTTRVKTGEVLFSYVRAFEPTAMSEYDANGKPTVKKYSSAILIPKTDKATVKAIKDAIQSALELGKAKHFGGTIPKTWKSPLRDGDEEKEEEEYKGHYFISAKNVSKPVILGLNRERIESEDDFYSGCYGKAIIDFYAYGFKVPSKGVGAIWQSALVTNKADRLGGGGASMNEILDAYGDDDDLL